MKKPAVYILSNKKHGTLYVGVTSDLIKRIWQHKNGVADGFTKKFSLHNLVHYELVDEMSQAISREKQLKNWKRDWKIALIEESNPEWLDLYNEITG